MTPVVNVGYGIFSSGSSFLFLQICFFWERSQALKLSCLSNQTWCGSIVARVSVAVTHAKKQLHVE